jgi:hypothetical protein
LLDSTFTVYRRKFLIILAITALFQLPYLAVQFFFEQSALGTIISFSSRADTGQTVPLGQLGPVVSAEAIVLVISLAYYLLLLPVAQGAVIRVVSDEYLDRPSGVGLALGTAWHRIRALIGYVLLELGIWVGSFLGVALLVFLVALTGAGAAAVGVLVLLFAGWFVFFLFTYIRFCLGIQAVVLERLSPVAALRRSMRLTRGSFWRIVLFYIVIGLVSGILSDILGLLPGLFVSALPLGTRAVIEVLATGVVQIFTSPFILILLTLVYYDIRIRREAFDIEMLAQSI